MSTATCQPDLLTTAEAAEYLGTTVGTMEVWRCVKRYALPYVRVGRLVRYRRADLEAWLASRTVSGAPENA